jgi:UDP-glucose 4-epimerase
MLFASSRETYGNMKRQGAIDEEMVWIDNCESPYSASKLAGEALTHAYSKVYGMEFIIARFSNVYGMYDDSDRVIPLWIRQTLNGDDLIVYGQDKVLDFTYIDDAIDGIVRVIDRFDQVRGNTFNLAYGKGISLVSVAQRIRELLKADNDITIEESRPGEVWRFEADLSKAKTLLDYQPSVGIEEGLERTVDWYKDFYQLTNGVRHYARSIVQFSSHE